MTDKKPLSDWLIVSDIDGTLNNKFRQFPERNRLAIERFVAEGGHFTLASGRNPQSMERHPLPADSGHARRRYKRRRHL